MVGGAAKDQLLVNPRNTIWGAKRLIGRKFNSRTVQEIKPYFSYEIVEGPQGEAAVMLGGKVHSLPQISSYVLAHIKTVAETFLGGEVAQAVISVPAYYNDNQRQAVKEAGRLAGFDVKRIVNEPTAAALAYGFNRGLDQRILVYDLGGGTFDVSVLDLQGNVFEVVATGGDTFLGGLDFDNRLIDYVLEEFRRETKIDLAQSPIAMQRLKGAAENAKMDLSLLSNVVLELPFITEDKRGKPVTLRLPLSRERLNALTSDLVDKTFAHCDRVLAEKNIDPKSIAEILLVGGQSRMPLVQGRAHQHFGRPPRKGVHPDECVALGAALLADSLGAADAVRLVDVLSIPIGIALPGGRLRKVLEKNTAIPVQKSFRLPPAKEDDPPFREVDIFQGEADGIVDCEYLGTLHLPTDAFGQRVNFLLDSECLLRVTVEAAAGAPKEMVLATRDTPASLRTALAEELERRRLQNDQQDSGRAVGLMASIRRIWGGQEK